MRGHLESVVIAVCDVDYEARDFGFVMAFWVAEGRRYAVSIPTWSGVMVQDAMRHLLDLPLSILNAMHTALHLPR